MESKKELISLFKKANENFISKHSYLLKYNLSERCIVAALAMELNLVKNDNNYEQFNVDVEYNKSKEDIKKNNGKKILCDLIMHKRGTNENLIILEMKKDYHKTNDKLNDIKRICNMTKESIRNFNYKLGIIYLIIQKRKENEIIYYINGEEVEKNIISWNNSND